VADHRQAERLESFFANFYWAWDVEFDVRHKIGIENFTGAEARQDTSRFLLAPLPCSH